MGGGGHVLFCFCLKTHNKINPETETKVQKREKQHKEDFTWSLRFCQELEQKAVDGLQSLKIHPSCAQGIKGREEVVLCSCTLQFVSSFERDKLSVGLLQAFPYA